MPPRPSRRIQDFIEEAVRLISYIPEYAQELGMGLTCEFTKCDESERLRILIEFRPTRVRPAGVWTGIVQVVAGDHEPILIATMDQPEYLDALSVPGVYMYGYDYTGVYDTARAVCLPFVTYDRMTLVDMTQSMRDALGCAGTTDDLHRVIRALAPSACQMAY